MANASAVFALAGRAAPPRRNGELVFEAPWESRLFGLTLALFEAGFFEWEEFRTLLCEEISAWEARFAPQESWSYYTRWRAAFERLLAQKGILTQPELEACMKSLSARPSGHDHTSLHADEEERTR